MTGARVLVLAFGALLVRDSAGPPLPFHYDLYTFRGTESHTSVVAAFAVPVRSLAREDAGDGVRYRFDVTLVLNDTARRTVLRRDDSVHVSLARALSDDHLLYTNMEVAARPSASTVYRLVMIDATKPGIGQLYSEGFPIPDYSGDALMLSDIALGAPDAAAGWTRGDVTLALLPTSQFPSSAFDVYYEIYNLPRGHRYSTEVIVERATETTPWFGRLIRRQEKRPVHVRFDGVSAAHADATVHELRRVDTSLGNGRYRITVNITDERTHQKVTRSREFDVRGWKRGATLVPALPWADTAGVQSFQRLR